MLNILQGDWIEQLRTLPDESVQCCVTSPPYWGLRDYGTAKWEGGSPDCDHKSGRFERGGLSSKQASNNGSGGDEAKVECPKCGARRVDQQLGLERTPQEYVEKIVAGFREVRRVLKDDGTLWINLGDSYAGSWGNYGGGERGAGKQRLIKHGSRAQNPVWDGLDGWRPPASFKQNGLKPKDLIGIPWLVAFALRSDGWVLRQEIIWSKKNPMPESVQDRCTKAHETIFMFSKAKWLGPPARQFARISEEDARWLALFLDTEGNITVKRSLNARGGTWYGAQICFANCHRGLLENAQSIIGAGTILQRGGLNAPMFYYQMSNNQAADLLHRLYPFLIVKQRQARLNIHLQEILGDSEHERRTKVGRLRGRGRSENYTALLEKLWATNKSLNHFANPDIAWIPEPKVGGWREPARYYYDADAIKEPGICDNRDGFRGENDGPSHYVNQPAVPNNSEKFPKPDKQRGHSRRHDGFNDRWDQMEREEQCSGLRNKRSVWTVSPAQYPEAHFATFPPDLIKPCILAGTRPGDTVLDPFFGSGTTGMVSLELGRKCIGIELNEKYIELARRRCDVTMGLPL